MKAAAVGSVEDVWRGGGNRTVLLAFVAPAIALSAAESLLLLLEVGGKSRGGLAANLLIAIAVCLGFGLGRQLALRDSSDAYSQPGMKSGSIIALILTISIAPVFVGGPLLVLGAAIFAVGLSQRSMMLTVWAIFVGTVGVYDTVAFYPPLAQIWLHSVLSLTVGILTVVLGLAVSRWRVAVHRAKYTEPPRLP